MAKIISMDTLDALKIMSIIEMVKELSAGGVVPFFDCTQDQIGRALHFDDKDNNRICFVTRNADNLVIYGYLDQEYFDKAYAYFDEDDECFGARLVLKDVYGRKIQFDVIKGEVYPCF